MEPAYELTAESLSWLRALSENIVQVLARGKQLSQSSEQRG